MLTRVEDVAERERKEEEWRQKRVMLKKTPTEAEKGYRRLIWMLREVVENPHSGLAGKLFACLSVIMVMVTVVSLCISTMPDLRDEETRVSMKDFIHLFFFFLTCSPFLNCVPARF